MSTVMILEDNNAKIENILTKNDCFNQSTVLIVRSCAMAKQLLLTMPTKERFVLYVDYELFPGCGSGFEFLEWVLPALKGRIDEVVITSMSGSWKHEMANLCKLADVKFSELSLSKLFVIN